MVKDLGTADVDAARLEAKSLFNVSNLLTCAQEERTKREAEGISDEVEALQPSEAPPFDIWLAGKQLEVLWPYQENGTTIKIWASGTVVRVADGLTDKTSKRARKILPAGALLWAWEANLEHDELPGEKWLILLPTKWNKQVQWSWRFDPCELAPSGTARPLPRRPRIEHGQSADEYLNLSQELI